MTEVETLLALQKIDTACMRLQRELEKLPELTQIMQCRTKRKEIKAPALVRCKLIDEETKRITSELLALEVPIDEQIKAEEKRLRAERRTRGLPTAAKQPFSLLLYHRAWPQKIGKQKLFYRLPGAPRASIRRGGNRARRRSRRTAATRNRAAPAPANWRSRSTSSARPETRSRA